MSTKRREPLRRLTSLLLAGVMVLGMCPPVSAAGTSGGAADSGSVTVTVDWNMKGAAVTGTSSEKRDAGTINVNVTPEGWKQFVYRDVHAGDTIRFDTRNNALPFIEAKVSEARDYGETVTRAELAQAMGVSEDLLGDPIPKVKNGNCYLIPDIPDVSPAGGGYATILAVYRGLSWNGSEDVIPGTEVIGTEVSISVPPEAVSGGDAALTSRWDFYAFRTTDKMYAGAADVSDAVPISEGGDDWVYFYLNHPYRSGADPRSELASLTFFVYSDEECSDPVYMAGSDHWNQIVLGSGGSAPGGYKGQFPLAGVSAAGIDLWLKSAPVDGKVIKFNVHVPATSKPNDLPETSGHKYDAIVEFSTKGQSFVADDSPAPVQPGSGGLTEDGFPYIDWNTNPIPSGRARAWVFVAKEDASGTKTLLPGAGIMAIDANGNSVNIGGGPQPVDGKYIYWTTTDWVDPATGTAGSQSAGSLYFDLAPGSYKIKLYSAPNMGAIEQSEYTITVSDADLGKNVSFKHSDGKPITRTNPIIIKSLDTSFVLPEAPDGTITFDQEQKYWDNMMNELVFRNARGSEPVAFGRYAADSGAGPYVYYVKENGQKRFALSNDCGVLDVTSESGKVHSNCHGACKPKGDGTPYDRSVVTALMDVAYDTRNDPGVFAKYWTMAVLASKDGFTGPLEDNLERIYGYAEQTAAYWGIAGQLDEIKADIDYRLSQYEKNYIGKHDYISFQCDGHGRLFIMMKDTKNTNKVIIPDDPVGPPMGAIPTPDVSELKTEVFPVIFNYAYTGGPVVTETVGKCKFDLTCHGTAWADITFGFYDPEYQYSAVASGHGWYRSRYIRPGWMFAGWSKDPINTAEKFKPGGALEDRFNGDSGFDAHGNGYYGDEVQDIPAGPTTFYGLWIPNEVKYVASGGYFYNISGAENKITTRRNVNDYNKNNRDVTYEYFNTRLDDPATYVVDAYSYPVPNGSDEFLAIMGGAGRREPVRLGYDFAGWYYDEACMVGPIDEFETGIQPGRSYFAGWKPDPVYVRYYDTREGGKLITEEEYAYGDPISLLDNVNDTDGQRFNNWVTKDGKPVVDGTSLTNSYHYDGSGWLKSQQELLTCYVRAEEFPEAWGDVVGKDYKLNWDLAKNGQQLLSGVIKNYECYWVLDVYTNWSEKTVDYTATIDWRDFSNNDGCRPKAVTLGLKSSQVDQTVATATLSGDMDTWQHTFEDLPITTAGNSLEEITYSAYIISYTDIYGKEHEIRDTAATGGEITVPTVSDADTAIHSTYVYGINNYMTQDYTKDPAESGGKINTRAYSSKITMDYGLITTGTDIKFTIQWDDDSNRDGQRPGAVKLALLGDGQPVLEDTNHNAYTGIVSVNPGMCEVSDDGGTWTYTFRDFQKYRNRGTPIKYTVAVLNDDTEYSDWASDRYNRNGYEAKYLNGSPRTGDASGVSLRYTPKEVEVPFTIVWNDSNNRDGQRPDYVSLALTSYQWNARTYSWEYMETASQTVRAGGANTMTAGTWTGTFGERYACNGGMKVIYHLSVTSNPNEFLPEGSFEYSWVETAHGSCAGTGDLLRLDTDPEVTISQNINTTSVTASVYWDDSQNNDGIRPKNIILQLYAHAPGGKPEVVDGQAYRVNLTGGTRADNWFHTFSGMPKYAGGQSGVELIYTVQAVEANGEPLYGSYIITANGEEEEVPRYEASYLYEGVGGNPVNTLDLDKSDRAYVKLSHTGETKTMNFSVNWHDGDDRDGVRPDSVPAALYKTVGDAEPVYLRAMTVTEGASGTWTQKVSNLSGYEDGKPVKYTVQVPEDAQRELASSGYTVTVQDNIIHMYYTPKTGSVSTKLYWSDNDNNDGYRPDSVAATLYANGVSTGKTIDLNGTNGWSGTWSGLDVCYVDGGRSGAKVVYNVAVEAPEDYEAAYEPASSTAGADEVLYIRLTHTGDTADVPVTVYWNDGTDNDGKRPDALTVLLMADGQPTEHTLTLDGTGNTWTGKFGNLPVYGGNGQKIYYSLKVYDDTVAAGGYSVMTAGTTLYMSYQPVKSSMYVSFQFDDGFNADGVRPTGLYLRLTADGVPVEDSEYKHTVSFDTNVDGYVWDFGELPVYAAGANKIAYNVDVTFDPELGAVDYSVWTSADIKLSQSASAAANQIIVKLSRSVNTTVMDGRIYWFDCNNVAGQRPDSLDLVMRDDADGSSVRYKVNAKTGDVTDRSTKEVVGHVEVAEWTGDSSVWSYTISGVPERYAHRLGASSRVYYYVTANTTSIARYYPTVLTGEDYGMDVALTHKDYETYAAKASQDFTVDVMWLDNSNAWGYRPDSAGVKVELLANGEVYDTIILTQAGKVQGSDNAWTHTFEGIPTYRNGGAIVWSVALPDLDKYTQKQTVFTANAATIAYTQATGFDLTVNWDDSGDDDAVRPESVTVDIYGDGTPAGSAALSGEGSTWTGGISGLPVWREGDPDAAVQYTFLWNDGTEQYLMDNDYAAFPTKGGESVSSDWSYWLSAGKFGDNTAEGYDQLTGTYDWETTLSRQQEKADRYFTVTFDDDANRDGIRPEAVKVELLADGEPIDAQEVAVNTTDSMYTLTWEQLNVYEAGKPINYTIRLADTCRGYKILYNTLNTAATLAHEPLRVVVTGTVEWDDSTQLVDVYNPRDQYVRSYEQIQRTGAYVRLLADGEPCGEPVFISASAYGTGEKLEPSAIAEWEGLYKYRDNGMMIVYTMEVYSDELQALLDDGHKMRYDFSTRYEPKAVVTHDLYDIRGTVYYMYSYNDDFLLKGVPVTAYLQNDSGTYRAMGSAVTGEDGQFEIRNLPQGLYIIRATYEYGGSVLAGTKGVSLDRKDGSATVIIDRGAVNDSDRYRYAAEGAAYYQTDITDGSTVKPVSEGSVVLLYRLDDSQEEPIYTGMTATDAGGHYKFEGLGSASYVVNVVFNYDGGTYTYDNADALSDGLRFNVSGANTAWGDIVKQVNAHTGIKDPEKPDDPVAEPPKGPVPCVAGGSVFYSNNGAHTTDPVEGVDVYVYLRSNAEVGHTVTDENGRWTVEGLGAADYTAVFSYRGSASRVLLFTVTDGDYEAGAYEAAPQYFDRTAETPAGTIRGTVLDDQGRPMRSLVGVYDANGGLLDFAYTDTYGVYTFTVAAGYDYNVRILAVEDEVERLPAGDPDDALTALDYYILSGTFHIDGEVQAGQLVAVYYETGGEYDLVTATLTDGDGKFAVKVCGEGSYRVCPYIDAEVYEVRNVSVGYQEERPSVSTAVNGSYTISGVEDYDSLTLYKISDSVETTVREISGRHYRSYEIGELDAGVYRLKLVHGGKETWYYLTCPKGTLVDVAYCVTISGSVTDGSGKAIAGAKAEIFNSRGEPAGEPKTILSDGGYAWSGLPEDKYEVVITRPNTSQVMAGKWTYEQDSYGTAYEDGMASGGTWSWNINAHMVSGAVTDQKGGPITGAYVRFTSVSDPDTTYVAVTDGDGRYAIGVVPGEYDAGAIYYWDTDHGYGVAGTTFLKVDGDKAGADFTIARHTLTIKAGRTVDGAPAPGTELEVRYADGTLYWTGKADEAGTASLTVFPGNYRISGKYDGSETVISRTVAGDMTAVLELDSAVYIMGTVRDGDGSAVSDGLVYYDNGNGFSGHVYTDDKGYYSIRVDPNGLGDYEIYAAQGSAIGEAVAVSVRTDVALDLTVAGNNGKYTVTGIVTDEGGKRLANALVTVTWGDDKTNTATTSTNSLGEYRVQVPDGTYYLTAAYEAANGERYETNSETAVHVAGRDITMDLMVLMGYDVEVTVVDENGDAVEGAAVYCTGAASGEAQTGPDGTAILHLPKGEYQFRAETESRSSGLIELTVSGREKLTLELENAGIFYEGPDVIPNRQMIWGWVYDPDGIPVQGAGVELYRQDLETLEWSLINSSETDSRGRYEFPDLDNGVYRVETVYTYVADAKVSDAGYVVSGVVTDGYGDPLSNCRVELWTQAGDLVAKVTAGDDGAYTFEGVDPDESYVVKAWDASEEPVMDEAAEVTATSAAISGTALDVAGNAAPGAHIEIRDAGGGAIATTVAGETGYYSVAVDGQASGYQVVIEYPASYEVDTGGYTRDTTDRNAPYLEPSWYTIEGFVHNNDGEPVEGAEVILTGADGLEAGRYVTEGDGYYIFDHLEDGIYHVRVVSPDGSERDYTVTAGDDANNIGVAIVNLSNGIVTAPDGGWYDGWNTFTVESSLACLVYVSDGGGLTRLEAEVAGGGVYRFTADLSEGDEIIVLVRGDVDLNGRLTLADLVRLSQYHGGKYDLREYADLAADVDLNGKLTLADLVRLSQYHGGKYAMTW